jgi:hypothetical protein
MTPEEQKEFDELSAVVKANGYMSLDSQEKRKRYSELKAQITESNELVSLTKGDLEAMIDKRLNAYKEEAKKSFEADDEGLAEAKSIGKWIKSKTVKKENPTAQLRVYKEDGYSEPGLVIDWKFLKKAFNEESRKYDIDIYRITVLYSKEEKTYDIPLIQLVQINEFERVEIIKQEVEEQELIQGKGRKSYNKGGYNFSDPAFFGTKGQESGESFDYKVVRKDVVCTVKRPNGKTLVINVDRLNQ